MAASNGVGVVVVFDFDKTIIDCDSDNWVVDALGATERFDELLINFPWNSAIDAMMGELHSQGKSVEEIERSIKMAPLSPRVVAAIESAHALGCELRILSDANAFFIETVLAHHGLAGYFSETSTNPARVDAAGRLRISPHHDFHGSCHGCTLTTCPPNMCKDWSRGGRDDTAAGYLLLLARLPLPNSRRTSSSATADEVAHEAVSSCLTLAHGLHHSAVTTTEGLGSGRGGLHAVHALASETSMAANSSSPSAGSDMSAPSLPPVRLASAAAAATTTIQPSSPCYFFSSLASSNASSHCHIAIAVDLSDESAFAVRWAVQNYLRPGDAVVLLHVRPTSILYGADWGSIPISVSDDDAGADGEDAPVAAAEGAEAASAEELQKKREEDFDTFTSIKAQDLAQPLVAAQIPFKIHVVKDHDMKERLCLEAERLGLSAMIMGSRGFGASRKGGKGRLGSVSDYCVHHCVCPVVVVRYPDDAAGIVGEAAGATDELHTVPEDEPVYHDAPDVHKEN